MLLTYLCFQFKIIPEDVQIHCAIKDVFMFLARNNPM